MPSVKSKNVIKALLKVGFFVNHQKGSHVQLRHENKSHLRVTVPRHDRFDLPLPVLISILRQAELNRDEFFELLKK